MQEHSDLAYVPAPVDLEGRHRVQVGSEDQHQVQVDPVDQHLVQVGPLDLQVEPGPRGLLVVLVLVLEERALAALVPVGLVLVGEG